MTEEIRVFDLKIGTGTKATAGALVELHYEVSETLGQLDGAAYIQSSWIRNRPLRVKVGQGQLRKDVDRALVGVTVGTDRRIVVPPGQWPDNPHGVAIAIYVQAVLKAPSAEEPKASSEQAWFAVPADDVIIEQWQLIIAALKEIQTGSLRKGELTGRARLRREYISQLVKEVVRAKQAGTVQYNLRELGETDGLVEFEMAINDAKALKQYLSREYGRKWKEQAESG